RRATGGLYAGDGFTLQDRYVALQVPMWLAEPAFRAFQQERLEDLDVWFDGNLREHHQVKLEALGKREVAGLIEGFATRNGDLVSSGRLHRFVIACPNF